MADDSDALAGKAFTYSPRDPELATRLMNFGMAELGFGHFDAAAAEFQKAINAGDHSFIPYVNLAAAYALAGRRDVANTALTEARRLNPQVAGQPRAEVAAPF
jgi:Flp pilus assembly protein TadD